MTEKRNHEPLLYGRLAFAALLGVFPLLLPPPRVAEQFPVFLLLWLVLSLMLLQLFASPRHPSRAPWARLFRIHSVRLVPGVWLLRLAGVQLLVELPFEALLHQPVLGVLVLAPAPLLR